MRVLVVLGPVSCPFLDIMAALSRAGAELCWISADKLPQIAHTEFDVALIDHHGAYRVSQIALKCGLVVMVQLDSIFYELPFLESVRRSPHYAGNIPIAYWLSCSRSAAFLDNYCQEIDHFHQLSPLLTQAMLALPEGYLCPPGKIDQHTTPISNWLDPMAQKLREQYRGKIYFGGSYDDFSSPPVDWPERGACPTSELDSIASSVMAGGQRLMDKISCVEQLLKRQDRRYLDHVVEFKGYHHYFLKYQAVHERGPIVRALKQRYGDEFYLFGGEWSRLGLPHYPNNVFSEFDPAAYYRCSPVSLDFGSQQLDSGWYQRSMETIKYGGRPLQLRRHDSAAIYGDVEASVAFDSVDRLFNAIDRCLGMETSSDQPSDERRAIIEYMSRRFDPAQIGAKILAQFECRLEMHRQRSGGQGTIVDNLTQARQFFDEGDYTRAIAAAQTVLGQEQKNAEAYNLLGRSLQALGQMDMAIKCLEAAVALDETSYSFHHTLGVALRQRGDNARAIACFQSALRITPNMSSTHIQWSLATLPGEWYHAVLGRFHEELRPKVYIEIGVLYGESLALARPPTRAIGIDPRPDVQVEFSAPTTIYPMTSEEFFTSVNFAEAAGQPTFDLAFIDGLHTFDNTLQDFIRIERHAGPHSVVLVHDCIPLDAETSTRDQLTGFWSGDVWKLVLCLKKYRPDLAIGCVATAPTGLGVISRLDPGSTILQERYDEIVAEHMPLDFGHLAGDPRSKLNVVPNDWAAISSFLTQRTQGRAERVGA